MLITNFTSKKLRFSIFKDISEDSSEEAFAHVIAPKCSFNLSGDFDYVVTEED